jgi:hypothetical protein
MPAQVRIRSYVFQSGSRLVANLDKFWVKLNSFCSVSDSISVCLSLDVCLVPKVNKMSNIKITNRMYDFAPELGW